MERAELIRSKDLVSYGSSEPPPPCGPGAEGFPTLAAYQAEESTLHLSEEEAREALVQFAASKCCYSSAPARQLVVQGLAALNTYRYQLQTFTESRSTLPASRPYKGEFVDSWQMGVPPGPWDIAVDPPPLFADCEVHLPVPHTSKVMDGLQQNCSHCLGSGRMRCVPCLGEGTVPCARCATKGLLLCFLELTITWKNNITEYVHDKDQGFPLSRLQEVTGKQLFSEEQPWVTTQRLPQPLVRGAESCLALHRGQLAEHTRILGQKQTIELIPLTRVDYGWRGRLHSFYVYGNENQVYAKDYPGKCCCDLGANCQPDPDLRLLQMTLLGLPMGLKASSLPPMSAAWLLRLGKG
ncbi:protein SSUH2 homolog [Indicator indicator]|uniref:protein SSUH2 homolog n=1 Tax=Indicator indicator TaxID=1002788 RepID=UPI0023DE72E2|nr:protein SSUH2 homolog [Indicator indicator]